MGSGLYSTKYNASSNSFARADKIRTQMYAKSSLHETFSNRSINNAMNPYGISVRESRDSNEHPNSLAIIIALDITGSMGTVPHFLIKEGLPDIMGKIIQAGITDPQVLFLAIGDHECDKASLQVGQFESSDKLLDHWLQEVFIESGGGANGGESYHLAWMLGAYHTSIDCLEKRGIKGVLFTIGDEPVLDNFPAQDRMKIIGPESSCQVTSASELLKAASEKYDVFHINVCQTLSGSRQHVIDGWKELMGDNLLLADKQESIAKIIANTIIATAGKKVVETEHGIHIYEKLPEDIIEYIAEDVPGGTDKEDPML